MGVVLTEAGQSVVPGLTVADVPDVPEFCLVLFSPELVLSTKGALVTTTGTTMSTVVVLIGLAVDSTIRRLVVVSSVGGCVVLPRVGPPVVTLWVVTGVPGAVTGDVATLGVVPGFGVFTVVDFGEALVT